MRGLPNLVQRAPTFFYVAAIAYFIASVVLVHVQLDNAPDGSGSINSIHHLVILGAWLQAAQGALYFVAYGVVAHILLAIWRQGQRPSDHGGDE
jgi:hypothetical protein